MVRYNVKYLNLYCGYTLTKKEKGELIAITLAEFDRPVCDRRKPRELVAEARNKVRILEIWNSNNK